jgi:hypothetical protein
MHTHDREGIGDDLDRRGTLITATSLPWGDLGEGNRGGKPGKQLDPEYDARHHFYHMNMVL